MLVTIFIKSEHLISINILNIYMFLNVTYF